MVEVATPSKVFISQPLTLETVDLHAQTVDTIGALARYISPDVIKPVAADCMELGIRIVTESDDPDLRRCTYGLFASLSVVLKEGMYSYLEKIGPMMIASLKSTEGIVAAADTSTQDPLFLIEDELDEEDLENREDEEEEDEDEPNQGYSVENAYMEEKEDTINSFVEIVENIGDPMMSSVKEVYKEVFLLTDYPHSNVRKAAVSGGCRLCAVMCKSLQRNTYTGAPELFFVAKESISSSLRVSTNVINADDERDVVIAVIEGLLELLEHLKLPQLVDQQDLKALGDSLCDVIRGKVNCQQFLDDDASQTSVDDDSQSELDLMLIEKCGDLLPLYAKLIGGEAFKAYFNIILPTFIKKTKKQSSVSEKSFAVGTLAEIIQAIGVFVKDYTPAIIQCLLKTLKDEDEEVRSNSAFAFGVLAESGGDAVTGYYMGILECFHVLLATGNQPALVQDNICGAIARMIMAAPQALPLDQVVPALASCLPIKEDERENETTTKCFVNLYANKPEMLSSYIDRLLPWFVASVEDEKSGLEDDTREKVKLVVSDIQQKYPQQFQQIMMERSS